MSDLEHSKDHFGLHLSLAKGQLRGPQACVWTCFIMLTENIYIWMSELKHSISTYLSGKCVDLIISNTNSSFYMWDQIKWKNLSAVGEVMPKAQLVARSHNWTCLR